MSLAFTPNTMKTMLNTLGGPALPTQFATIISPPRGMKGGKEFFSSLLNPSLGIILPAILSAAGSANLSVMTEKTAIPGKGFGTTPIVRHGKHMLMPYGVNHETMRMSFICTNSMLERTFFDYWMQFIQKPDSHYMEYFDTYTTTITIKKLSGSGLVDNLLAPGIGMTANNALVEAGSALSTYFLQEAYPVRIGAQELSYGDTNSYMTLDVEFAYTHLRCVLDDLVPWIFGGPEDSITPSDAFSDLFPSVPKLPL